MFEQATLTNGPAGKRVWTTILGVTSQMALVSLAVLAPMVWPQVLPLTNWGTTLAPPQPPGPKHLGDEAKKQMEHVKVVKAVSWSLTAFQPKSVPDKVTRLVEEQPVGFSVPGALPADGNATGTGIPGGILDFAREVARPMPPPVVEKAVVKPPVEVVPAIQRYTQGGRVQLGRILHRVEPSYPAMARAARVSGDVVLECVVGIDGRIHEVKVKNGNALLVKSAVDAAWQWAYEPTQLNSVPIEIITILTFNFKLN